MRSRNEHFNLLLSICAIIFFTTALQADEYIISSRYVVKNAMLVNESLEVSHAMTRCLGDRGASLLLESDGSRNLRAIIKKHSDRFDKYLSKLGLEIKANESNSGQIDHSLVVMTFKPTCFTVDFNQNFVKITALQ